MDCHVPQESRPGTDDKRSHVSVGQCSHVSQLTEEEAFPVITRRTPRTEPKTPVLRYTNNTETPTRHTSSLINDINASSPRQTTNSPYKSAPSPYKSPASPCKPPPSPYKSPSSPCGLNSQSDLKSSVILPRLANSEQKCSSPTRSSDGEQIKFPHIGTISRANAHLALNRSITDLLDPEMEILNKIKHIPKRKRRRRKQKLVNPNSVLTLKCHNDLHTND